MDTKVSNTGLGPTNRPPDSQVVWSHGFGPDPINKSCSVTWIGPKPTTRLDSPIVLLQGFDLNPTPRNFHDNMDPRENLLKTQILPPAGNTAPAGN